MLFNTKNPYEIEKLTERLKSLVERGAVIELTEKHRGRTLAQNAYLHVIISFFASQYGCSEPYAKQEIFKRMCNPDLFVVEKYDKKNGRAYQDLKSSSVLDTAQMTMAIERFRNWSSAVAGCYLPTPNEEDMLFYCRQEIERNREYLQTDLDTHE